MTDLTESHLDSEQLVDGKLLKVYRDRVRLPDGKESVREWIDHPGAAAVVPLFDDGSTLLIRQYRYPSRRTFLEVPAGKIDIAGQDPEAVAGRELEEETGWKANSLTRLGVLYPCIGYSNEIIHFYLGENLEKGEQQLGDGEFVELVPVGFDEALERVASGEIVDMKTVAALYLARDLLERRWGEDRGAKVS
ncbi:MAG: NUDIX hydrolase [Rhodothermales bacterium]